MPASCTTKAAVNALTPVAADMLIRFAVGHKPISTYGATKVLPGVPVTGGVAVALGAGAGAVGAGVVGDTVGTLVGNGVGTIAMMRFAQ